MQNLPFIAWCLNHLNYWVVVVLMAIESSFIPFPSEIVIPPAAYIAASGQGDMNVVLVVVAGTLGAIIGAFVNYYLSRWLGRPIVYAFANSRLGHICLIDAEKVRKAEHYFVNHGMLATLVGRLVPAVRQLISIPAGLARMNVGRFALYTFAGATLWNTILAIFGYWLESIVPYDELDATVAHYYVIIKWAMTAVGIAAVLYLVYKGVKGKE